MRRLEELQAGIAQGDLVLHYQPQLTLRTGEILAVEALLRWAHPRLGLLPPDNFLPIAEEAGLMDTITAWVLDEAAAQCMAWREAGRPLTMAVNVSPNTLLAPGFVEMVRSCLDRHDLAPENLVLELTESSVMDDLDHGGPGHRRACRPWASSSRSTTSAPASPPWRISAASPSASSSSTAPSWPA